MSDVGEITFGRASECLSGFFTGEAEPSPRMGGLSPGSDSIDKRKLKVLRIKGAIAVASQAWMHKSQDIFWMLNASRWVLDVENRL